MNIPRRLVTILAPVTTWLVLFSLVPLVVMAVYSLQGSTLAGTNGIFTIEHYGRFFATSSFQTILLKTILVAFVTAVLSVGLAFPLAYYLSFYAGKSRLTLLMFIVAPAWTSELLRILAWKLLLGSNGGFNFLLMVTKIISEPLTLLQYGNGAVLMTLVYTWVPFSALPIFAALERIDRPLLDAAADLGMNPLQVFLRVTLPLSLPGVIGSFFFTFIPTLGEWVTPAVIGGTNGILFGNLVQDQYARALNFPLGAAFSNGFCWWSPCC